MIDKLIAALVLAGTLFMAGDGIVKHNRAQTGFGVCLLVLYVVVLFMTRNRVQREGRRRSGKEAKDKK